MAIENENSAATNPSVSPEGQKIVDRIQDAQQELHESAMRSQGFLALDRAASAPGDDWDQSRIDAVRRHQEAQLAGIATASTETDSQGVADATQPQEPQYSGEAALAALEAAKRNELLGLEQAAASGEGWPQDRYDAAKQAIEDRYAKASERQ